MIKIGVFLDKATCFLIDPSNKNFSPKKKAIAWAVTTLAAMGTIGIAQGVSALWRRMRHVKENDTHELIGKIFRNIFPKKTEAHPKEKESQESEVNVSEEVKDDRVQMPGGDEEVTTTDGVRGATETPGGEESSDSSTRVIEQPEVHLPGFQESEFKPVVSHGSEGIPTPEESETPEGGSASGDQVSEVNIPTSSHVYEVVSSSDDSTNVTGDEKGPMEPPDARKIAFGKEQWEEFGDVGDEPNFPEGINEILASDCKIFPGKKVWETHVLVLIPKTIKINNVNEPLNLNLLTKLMNSIPTGNTEMMRRLGKRLDEEKYMGVESDRFVQDEYKNQFDDSHWVLITKEVIGGDDLVNGSRNKSYREQIEMLKEIAGPLYKIPSLRDVVVCTCMHYINTRESLFDNAATRCLEKDELDHPICVGFEGPDRIKVRSTGPNFQLDLVGMAAVRKFTSGV